MSTMLKKAMKQGAFGVSFGLAYSPGVTKEELYALFEIASQFDGLASIHPRGHAAGIPSVMPDGL